MAKESVVSTLTVLLGEAGISGIFTQFTAFVFLVFTLIYTPCVAAVASVKRELGAKWALFVVFMQCAVAWAVAFLVHGVGMLAGLT